MNLTGTNGYNMFKVSDDYYVFKRKETDRTEDSSPSEKRKTERAYDIITKSIFKLFLSGAFMYVSIAFMTENEGVSAVRIFAAILIFLISATVFAAEFKVMCTRFTQK